MERVHKELIECLQDYMVGVKLYGVSDNQADYICNHMADWYYERYDGDCDDDYMEFVDYFRRFAPTQRFFKDIYENPRCHTYKDVSTAIGWFGPVQEDVCASEWNYMPSNMVRVEFVERLIEYLKSK